MIRQLRQRNRADAFKNDVRSGGRKKRLGRWIYLSLVLVTFLWIANTLLGPIIWLRAGGIVNAESIILTPSYDSQVVQVEVVPGERVRKGMVLARINSPDAMKSIAELSARYAETYARQAELTIRSDVARTLTTLSSERLREAEASLKRFRSARDSGLVTDPIFTSVLREHYTARQEQLTHEAERRATARQLENLANAQEEALRALRHIQENYNGGVIRAPENGVVGPVVAGRGDILQPGYHLLQLYAGTPHVLAYLEIGTFYEVQVGERVLVSNGVNDIGGTIKEILPVAVQLPPEFQKTFQPTNRGQVARIELDELKFFPLLSKVQVRGEFAVPGQAKILRVVTGWYEENLASDVKAGMAVLRRIGSDLLVRLKNAV
jgi:multidrug resistance efflux pump